MYLDIICSVLDVILIILIFWDGGKTKQINDLNTKVDSLSAKVRNLEILSTLQKTNNVESKFSDIKKTGIY